MSLKMSDILTPARAVTGQTVTSKKKLLELLGQRLAEQLDAPTAEEIFDRLLERERLGSTGFGDGIAIPHCRLPGCNSAMGLLVQLREPIDFDAVDRQPVDLIFTLVVPEQATEEHLQVLAMLAERFQQPNYRQSLRQAENNTALFEAATQPQ